MQLHELLKIPRALPAGQPDVWDDKRWKSSELTEKSPTRLSHTYGNYTGKLSLLISQSVLTRGSLPVLTSATVAPPQATAGPVVPV